METTAQRSRLLQAVFWLHRKLLPNAAWAGWTPYLWLIYLGFFFVRWPGMDPWDATQWTFALMASFSFLVLYFRSFNCNVRELPRILASMSTLGYIFVMYTGTGSTFIIYACALSAHYANQRKSLTALALILSGYTLECIAMYFLPWVGYAHSIWFWLPTFMIGGVIGAANAWFADDDAKRRVILESQEEIRRLAATAERERIARDLHDLLGHTLTLVTVKAELAARLLERDAQGAAREVRELERISREALRQVREAVGGYRSGGIVGELVNARVALKAAKVELTAEIDGKDCPPSHDNLFALVLREAVTNILRHSGAKHCKVRLHCHDRTAQLVVEDDGRGGKLKEGNGIRGMRERLGTLEGRLEIESGREGTRVTASLPLDEPVPAAEAQVISWPGLIKNRRTGA